MNKYLNNKFNDEVERYRRTLLFYAKKCEWDTFKVIAGKLFDYVESIEMKELERRFFTVFKIIMAVIFLAVIIVFRMNAGLYPEIVKIKNFVILMAIGASCYELYLFFNFNMYMDVKTTFYRKRREKFIRNIEQDFRKIAIPVCS